MLTEKTFGTKDPTAKYYDRPGAYLIAIESGAVHVVRTQSTGLLLPGGGLCEGESHEDCIRRECLEETGYDVSVEDYVTSADTYCTHPKIGAFHPIQTYYSGQFLEQIDHPNDPSVTEHILLPLTELDKLYSPMQKFAVEQCIEMLRSDAHGSDDEDL